MSMAKRHRLLWGITVLAILGGALACYLAGRTMAHAMTIASAAIFLSGAVYLADVYVPFSYGRKTRILTAATSGLAFLWLMGFYAWEMAAAETVYVFDNFQFYEQQIILSTNMAYGLRQTWALLLRTIANNDYTYVMNVLLAPLFAMTDRTIQSFTLCVTFMTWVPLMYFLRKFALLMGNVLRLGGVRTVLLNGALCIIACCMPIIHAAAIKCQASLLAMVFFVEIVFLSWGDDSWNTPLRRTDWQRRIALFMAVILLAISRRWYVFPLLGYLIMWAGVTLYRLLRVRDWRGLWHYLAYGAFCVVMGLLLLEPFIRHALKGNYTTAYAYWNKGGIAYELANQARYNGLIWLVIIGLGYLWAFCQRRFSALKPLALTTLLGSAIAMVAFTRIQNMYHHQSLILVPGYMFGLLMAFAALLTLSRRFLRGMTAGALSLALMWQFGHCVDHPYPDAICSWTSNITLKPPYRADMAQVWALSDYISAHCTPDSKAFFLTDNELYNRTVFTNVRYPNTNLRTQVVLGHYTFRTYGFPEEWFTAGLYMVPADCQTNHKTGVLEKLRVFLLEEYPDRFDRVATFSFATTDMHVYKRKGPVQTDEVEALLTLFAEEGAEYPDIFSGRIERHRPVSP